MKALKFTAVALAMFAAGSASAALTLNTTKWTAHSYLTFSVSGSGAAEAAGIAITGAGNTVTLPNVETTDPETGLPASVQKFDFPVTRTSVKLFSGGKLVKPVTGDVIRSGLKFCRGSTCQAAAGIGNFSVNFETNVLTGDVFTPTGTLSGVPIFTFTNDNNTVVALKGFAIKVDGSVRDLVFTADVTDALATALRLSAPLKASLSAEKWGTVVVDVSSKKSGTTTNATPLTAADLGI